MGRPNSQFCPRRCSSSCDIRESPLHLTSPLLVCTPCSAVPVPETILKRRKNTAQVSEARAQKAAEKKKVRSVFDTRSRAVLLRFHILLVPCRPCSGDATHCSRSAHKTLRPIVVIIDDHQTQKARRREVFKRAEKYVQEYRKKQKSLVDLRRQARKEGNFFREPESKLAFVVRIRGYVAPSHVPSRLPYSLNLWFLLRFDVGAILARVARIAAVLWLYCPCARSVFALVGNFTRRGYP